MGEPVHLQLALAPRAPTGSSWGDTTGLPPGVTLSDTGLLAGTPTQSGTFVVTYQTRGTAPATTGHTGTVLVKVTAASVSLSAGGQDTCLTRSDGTARCWGRNNYGQIGDGTILGRNVPDPGARHRLGRHRRERQHHLRGQERRHPVVLGARQLRPGRRRHRCAIRGPAPGRHQPRLGQGLGRVQPHLRDHDRRDPVVLGPEPPWSARDRYRRPAARQARPRVGTGTGWESVTTGGWHTCALTIGGTAYCWGQNDFGELGDGTITTHPTPTRWRATPRGSSSRGPGARPAASPRPGRMLCWGFNRQGQLGRGDTTNSALPVAVAGTQVWTQVATGDGSTCGVDSGGQMWCWGDNRYGQLGLPASTGRGPRPESR